MSRINTQMYAGTSWGFGFAATGMAALSVYLTYHCVEKNGHCNSGALAFSIGCTAMLSTVSCISCILSKLSKRQEQGQRQEQQQQEQGQEQGSDNVSGYARLHS